MQSERETLSPKTDLPAINVHIASLDVEASKIEGTILGKLLSIRHAIKIFGQFLVFLMVAFCAALSMLGISVSFVQLLVLHFLNINTYGLTYLKDNLTSIGVNLGSLLTCLALFYKLEFAKLAHRSYYNNSICYSVLGWWTISLVYSLMVYFITWCLDYKYFIISVGLAGLLITMTPVISYRQYRNIAIAPKDNAAQHQDGQTNTSNIENVKTPETVETHKIDWAVVKNAVSDIAALLVAAVALSTGVVMLSISYIDIVYNIWTYDDSCRMDSDANSDAEAILTDIMAGCFVIAAAMNKLEGHLNLDNNRFQNILFALIALPCVYFSTVILASI